MSVSPYRFDSLTLRVSVLPRVDQAVREAAQDAGPRSRDQTFVADSFVGDDCMGTGKTGELP
ncbi:hypothetical protein [Sphingopyxis sp. GC21]|uniref:hypothetical protein n=1 Tax=Sphingopyxis sp. GC21 TaxID=2933562 RepID=UPI0021E4534F|nr:hypothetical protein [Sphingopyxis sp. GC21]